MCVCCLFVIFLILECRSKFVSHTWVLFVCSLLFVVGVICCSLFVVVGGGDGRGLLCC